MPPRRKRNNKNNRHRHQYYQEEEQELTRINPQAYFHYPIPDTRNKQGEYIGPTDFVAVW